jgi:hypothetical protein
LSHTKPHHLYKEAKTNKPRSQNLPNHQDHSISSTTLKMRKFTAAKADADASPISKQPDRQKEKGYIDMVYLPTDQELIQTNNTPDIYRRQARHLAWYDQDGEPSSHNPFKKFRRRPRRTHSIQLEEQRGASRSMGDLSTSEDQRRRAEMNTGLSGPEHSDTFPPESAGSDASPSSFQHATAAGAKDHQHQFSSPEQGPEPSMRSQDPINVSSSRGLDLEGENGVGAGAGKPRSRFLGKFRRQKAEGDVEEVKDAEDVEADGPNFTIASQLRATILNSWINVLIFAAPAGSRFFFLSFSSSVCPENGIWIEYADFDCFSCALLRGC